MNAATTLGQTIDHPDHGRQKVTAVYPGYYLLENGVTIWRPTN